MWKRSTGRNAKNSDENTCLFVKINFYLRYLEKQSVKNVYLVFIWLYSLGSEILKFSKILKLQFQELSQGRINSTVNDLIRLNSSKLSSGRFLKYRTQLSKLKSSFFIKNIQHLMIKIANFERFGTNFWKLKFGIKFLGIKPCHRSK